MTHRSRKLLVYLAAAALVIAGTSVSLAATRTHKSLLFGCVHRGNVSLSTSPHCRLGHLVQWTVTAVPPPLPTTTSTRVTTTTAGPPPAGTTVPTTTTTVATSPDDLPGPVAGFTQVCAEDFSKPAALGSWGTSDASKVVYIGARGCKWNEYPDGWSSTFTNGNAGYAPAQVLSVHDGVLDFNLHPIGGHAQGANPSPILGSSNYATYGKFIVRMRVDHVDGYHDAFLLWPHDESNWQSAESDFPEMDFTENGVSAFAHTGNGSQDAFDKTVDFTQWHTYEQDWAPGKRTYLVDGQVIGTSTKNVYTGPERWQLQTEPSGTSAGGSGHQLIDWVVAYVAS